MQSVEWRGEKGEKGEITGKHGNDSEYRFTGMD
jgi:hypothetical protein